MQTRQYTNPAIQAASDGVYKAIEGFDSVIELMTNTRNMMYRRESDKSRPELTQSQIDTIARNQGVHIYGQSHPLYKG